MLECEKGPLLRSLVRPVSFFIRKDRPASPSMHSIPVNDDILHRTEGIVYAFVQDNFWWHSYTDFLLFVLSRKN